MDWIALLEELAAGCSEALGGDQAAQTLEAPADAGHLLQMTSGLDGDKRTGRARVAVKERKARSAAARPTFMRTLEVELGTP